MVHLSNSLVVRVGRAVARAVTTCDLQLFFILSIDDPGGVQVHSLINGFSPATMPLSGHVQLGVRAITDAVVPSAKQQWSVALARPIKSILEMLC